MELVNVRRTACVRQRRNAQQAQAMLQRLAMLPIEIDRHPAPRSGLLVLALRFDLGSQDGSGWPAGAAVRPAPQTHRPGRRWNSSGARDGEGGLAAIDDADLESVRAVTELADRTRELEERQG
ncbi:MAG: hypothetical protein KGK09_06540 [Burkholderiales bacterium]|nr:hypothetical protein [Burkholderiales bacterium]